MAQVMKMHPDLMGAAAVQRALQQTHFVVGAQNAIFRFRCASAIAPDAHPLAMHRMPGDGGIDRSGRLPQNTGDEREINFLHRARGELL